MLTGGFGSSYSVGCQDLGGLWMMHTSLVGGLWLHYLTFQGGGSAVGDFYLDVLSGLGIAAVEDDDLVLAVAAEKLLFAAMRSRYQAES